MSTHNPDSQDAFKPWPFLFSDTTREEVMRWARNLNYMRLCKGARSGHANEGDSYQVKFRFANEAELIKILNSLRIYQTTPQEIDNSSSSHYIKRMTLSTLDIKYQGKNRSYPDRFISGIYSTYQSVCDDSEISYAPISIYITRDNFLLLKMNIYSDSETAKEKDYGNAKYLDRLIENCADHIVEPPMTNNRCISPIYYPEIWVS